MSTVSGSGHRPLSIFSLERMRTDKRITVLTIVGILLVPLAIGGLLVWALWNPTDRLGDVKAAVVNLDKPVTLNGQTVPLGRQFAAGLIGSAHDNYGWVLTDPNDAAHGLADGTYVSVVTIPKGFSKAATSQATTPADATQATIDVQTSARSRLVDPAISQAVTSTATAVLNKQLTSTYLSNVYVGFNTLHSRLGSAASGSSQLSGGIAQLAAGTHQLGAAAGQIADGVSSLSSGASQLSSGASSLSGGLSRLDQKIANPTTGLVASTSALAAGSDGVATGVSNVASGLKQLGMLCDATHGSTDPVCVQLANAYAGMTTGNGGSPSLVAAAGAVAGGNAALASGMPALTSGIAQSADGAATLASGAGASAGGAAALASGAAHVRDGVLGLATGADASSAGAASLSSGLATATAQLPTYSSAERAKLAAVAAEPVVQNVGGAPASGASGIPLFAALALWLGALATFIVLQAASRRAMLTTRASGLITLDGLLPAAALGALQGVLVAGVMQFALSFDLAHWLGFAGVAAAAGVAFAAVNQGLVALLGGVGRFVSMLVVVITLASGIVSTVPVALASAMAWLPTSAAMTALHGVVDSSTGDLWRGLGGLLLWAGLGVALTTVAVARRRIVRVAALLPAE